MINKEFREYFVCPECRKWAIAVYHEDAEIEHPREGYCDTCSIIFNVHEGILKKNVDSNSIKDRLVTWDKLNLRLEQRKKEYEEPGLINLEIFIKTFKLINIELFEKQEEHGLFFDLMLKYTELKDLYKDKKQIDNFYLKILNSLTTLNEPINNFMDNVKINVSSDEIYSNRKRLLECCHLLTNLICDLSQLVGIQSIQENNKKQNVKC